MKGTNNNPGQCSALESPSGTIYNSPSSAFTTFVHKCQITRWEKGRLVYSKAGANLWVIRCQLSKTVAKNVKKKPPADSITLLINYKTSVGLTPSAHGLTKGSLPTPKRMNFRKSSKRPLTPPPIIFGKSCCGFRDKNA